MRPKLPEAALEPIGEAQASRHEDKEGKPQPVGGGVNQTVLCQEQKVQHQVEPCRQKEGRPCSGTTHQDPRDGANEYNTVRSDPEGFNLHCRNMDNQVQHLKRDQ